MQKYNKKTHAIAAHQDRTRQLIMLALMFAAIIAAFWGLQELFNGHEHTLGTLFLAETRSHMRMRDSLPGPTIEEQRFKSLMYSFNKMSEEDREICIRDLNSACPDLMKTVLKEMGDIDQQRVEAPEPSKKAAGFFKRIFGR